MSPLACGHESDTPLPICLHLVPNITEFPDYYRYFIGDAETYTLLCEVCTRDLDTFHGNLRDVCPVCFQKLDGEGIWEGTLGAPEIQEASSDLRFSHRTVSVMELIGEPVLDIQPLPDRAGSHWLGLTQSGILVHIRCDIPVTVERLCAVGRGEHDRPFTALAVAPGGELAAVYEPLGNWGKIVEIATGRECMILRRDGYRTDVSSFPIAFFVHDGRLLLVHGTRWNRLDISDPWTGDLLTERTLKPYRSAEPMPEHYNNMFDSRLTVSPDYEWIIEEGWVWTSIGVGWAWSLKRWIEENVYEPEDGPSRRGLTQRWFHWDSPLCWVDNRTVAIWGIGDDGKWLVPGVTLFDVESKSELRSFMGPATDAGLLRHDALVFDTYLFSSSFRIGMQVWNIDTGARVLHDPSFTAIRYHRGTKEFLSRRLNSDFQLSRLVEE